MRVGLTATMIQGGKSGVAQYVFSLVRELVRGGRVDLTVFALEDYRAAIDEVRQPGNRGKVLLKLN